MSCQLTVTTIAEAIHVSFGEGREGFFVEFDVDQAEHFRDMLTRAVERIRSGGSVSPDFTNFLRGVSAP